jgi:hypothetical protein
LLILLAHANDKKNPALSFYEYIHAFGLRNKGQRSVEQGVEPGGETVALLGELKVDLEEDQWAALSRSERN